MYINSLRCILINEFNKPEKVGKLDIVEVMFSYHEDVMPDGRVNGYFCPLPKREGWCMWLEKKNGIYSCKLFWNKSADKLVGFPEQVVSKGRGCTLEKQVPIIPMVYRNGKMFIEIRKKEEIKRSNLKRKEI